LKHKDTKARRNIYWFFVSLLLRGQRGRCLAGKLNCIVIDCADAKRASEFWVQALEGYEVDAQEWGISMKSESDPLIYFEVVPEGKTVKNRLHLNIRAADREAEVQRLVGLRDGRRGEVARRGLRLDKHERRRGERVLRFAGVERTFGDWWWRKDEREGELVDLGHRA